MARSNMTLLAVTGTLTRPPAFVPHSGACEMGVAVRLAAGAVRGADGLTHLDVVAYGELAKQCYAAFVAGSHVRVVGHVEWRDRRGKSRARREPGVCVADDVSAESLDIEGVERDHRWCTFFGA